jgi:uncharacterized protein YndB with AHSA1/START domain
MPKVTESVTIQRPPEELFGLAVDPEQHLEWNVSWLRSVDKLITGPLAAGSQYRGRVKGVGTVEYQLTEYEAPRHFSRDAVWRLGRIHHTFDFDAVPEGTRLTQHLQLEPRGLGKVLTPLAKPLLRKRARTIDQELKSYAERTS